MYVDARLLRRKRKKTRRAVGTRGSRPAVAMALLLASAANLAAPSSIAAAATRPQDRVEQQIRDFEANTGLALTEIPDTEGTYLAKTHRGYEVLFTTQMGDVWGRYFARLAMGEIGREVGGLLSFLTGSYEHGGSAAGSILDRQLAKVIGQPLGIMVYLSHGKEGAPRLDIVSGSSTIKPEEELRRWERIGFGPGSLYADNEEFAQGILADDDLRDRLKKFRGQYIFVDDTLVSFIWSGQEIDFSANIREHDDYYAMINSIMDILADIADHIPAAR